MPQGRDQVSSFGRRAEPAAPTPPGPVMLPPMVMPPVQLPLVLVVNPAALAEAAAQIQAMVAQAVRDGLAQGYMAGPAPEVSDGVPGPDPAHLTDLFR